MSWSRSIFERWLSIPWSGRSPREGIGYPFQYSWASHVAQLVKNLPAMWETWVWSLGWEDSLSTPVFWPGEFHGVTKSQTWLHGKKKKKSWWIVYEHFQFIFLSYILFCLYHNLLYKYLWLSLGIRFLGSNDLFWFIFYFPELNLVPDTQEVPKKCLLNCLAL